MKESCHFSGLQIRRSTYGCFQNYDLNSPDYLIIIFFTAESGCILANGSKPIARTEKLCSIEYLFTVVWRVSLLFEQAFMALPEFLTGLPYSELHYEGSLLSAFSMSILQELNGRNVNNPISCLRSEVKYPSFIGKRADMHLDLQGMNIFTEDLFNYGVYRHNWLEGKFFRNNNDGNITVDKTTSTILLLNDIIRLLALVPDGSLKEGEITEDSRSDSGRYLLHAYQENAEKHIALRRNGRGEEPSFERTWIKNIRKPGTHEINIICDKEVTKFDEMIGNQLRYLRLSAKVTNLVYESLKKTERSYDCYLTRIDDFEIQLNGHWFKRKNGKFSERYSESDEVTASYKTIMRQIKSGLL